jgi:hypothetical protein
MGGTPRDSRGGFADTGLFPPVQTPSLGVLICPPPARPNEVCAVSSHHLAQGDFWAFIILCFQTSLAALFCARGQHRLFLALDSISLVPVLSHEGFQDPHLHTLSPPLCYCGTLGFSLFVFSELILLLCVYVFELLEEWRCVLFGSVFTKRHWHA